MSAKNFYYTKAALGLNPFRCPLCHQLLSRHIGGNSFELTLDCRNCRTEIQLKAKNPIPVSRMLQGENIQELQQHFIGTEALHTQEEDEGEDIVSRYNQ